MRARLGLDAIRRRFTWKRAIIGVVALLVLWIVLRLIFGGGQKTEFVTQDVKRASFMVTVSATGTLAPRDQVDVGAEVSGRLDAVLVDFNDRVKKGEILARINTDQIEAQLSQARATLAQAHATLIQDGATIKRYIALRKSNALSPQEYDNAVGEYARAKAGVAMAQGQVDQDQTLLGKATVRAPIDGVVLDRKVEAGQTVVAAMTTPVLFTLASDLSQMELDVDIDEADVGSVRSGLHATFTVDAYPSRTFSATLISVHNAPKTVQGVVTYQGVLLVANPQHLLKPGMTASAEIKADSVSDVLVVPNSALRFTPPPQYLLKLPPPKTGPNAGRVWVVDGDKVTPRDLVLGATNSQLTQVKSGTLAAGEKIATDLKIPAP